MKIEELKELVKPIKGLRLNIATHKNVTYYSLRAAVSINKKQVVLENFSLKDLDRDKLIMSAIKRMTESVARCQNNKLNLWLKNNDAIVCPEYPNYYISKGGKIYSTIENREIKGASANGYIQTLLMNDNGVRHIYLHQLVGMTYLDYKRPSNMDNWNGVKSDTIVINHINENRSDNRLENLEVITSAENIAYSKELRAKRQAK